MRVFNDVDLHAFVDGQVTPERRETIAGALKASPVDAARVELWRRQNLAIKAMFSGPEVEPVPLWLTVGQIASARSKPVPLPKQQQPRKVARPSGRSMIGDPSRISPRLAAVLAFALGVTVPLALDRLHMVPQLGAAVGNVGTVPGFAARALDAHTLFGLDPDRPVDELDLPQGSLKAWLEKRVSFRVAIPSLQRLGWTLRGGRIAAGEVGPAALLVYENGAGNRLSLFASRLTRDATVGSRDAQGTMINWVESGIGYALIDTSAAGALASQGDQLREIVQRSSRGD